MTRRTARRFLIPLVFPLLGACSAAPYTSIHPQGPPLRVGLELHRVSRDYLNRYVCANGATLMCTCASRLARECLCTCSATPNFPRGFGR